MKTISISVGAIILGVVLVSVSVASTVKGPFEGRSMAGLWTKKGPDASPRLGFPTWFQHIEVIRESLYATIVLPEADGILEKVLGNDYSQRHLDWLRLFKREEVTKAIQILASETCENPEFRDLLREGNPYRIRRYLDETTDISLLNMGIWWSATDTDIDLEVSAIFVCTGAALKKYPKGPSVRVEAAYRLAVFRLYEIIKSR